MNLSTAAEFERTGRRCREYTMKEALDKVYIIRHNRSNGYVTFPKCLSGKRIKIILED